MGLIRNVILYLIYFGGYASITIYAGAKLDAWITGGRTFDEMAGLMLIGLGLAAGMVLAGINAYICIPLMAKKPVIFWINGFLLLTCLLTMLFSL